MDEATEQSIKRLIAAQLQIDIGKVTPSSRFIEDLKADSLDLIEIIMALEEQFGKDIPDEQAEKLLTVQSVMDYFDE